MHLLLLFISKINAVIEKILSYILLLLLWVFTIIVIYQILSRNVPLLPTIYWTEEISRFTFQWMVMLGAAVGVLNSDHFLLDIFENKPHARKAATYYREIAILFITIVFIIYGYKFAAFGLKRTSMAANISMVWVYSCYFISGIFMTLFTIQRLLLLLIFGMDGLKNKLQQAEEK